MPELPEVQTVVTSLRNKILHQKILGVQIFCAKVFASVPADIVGQTILDVMRRGKYIILKLSDGYLVVHLRMTGRFFAVAKNDVEHKQGLTSSYQRHLHVIVELQDYLLLFQDQRKFGRMQFYQNINWLDLCLGPEPLLSDFTVKYLMHVCKSKKSIKALLLDQSKIAGLGNIYVDEVLWQAEVHPLTLANAVPTKKLQIMHKAIREILQQAILMQGTTFLSYAFDGNKEGNFLNHLKVFNRAKLPCLRCGTLIIKIKVAQRGTHVCLNCQN